MANIHNNQNHNLYHFCNGQTFAQMWGIVGSVSAGLSPLCFLTDSTGNIVVAGPAMAGIIDTVLIVAASIYFGCYLLRRTAAMRVRRGWIGSAAINLVVSIIVTIVAVERKATASDIFGLSLVAVAVFALSEVAKPIADFGLVQAFLRMPLQTALVCRFVLKNQEVGAGVVAVTAMLLFFGTMWQVYFAVGEIWPVNPANDGDVNDE